MNQNERLSVLILEDDPQDAELELHELKRAGFPVAPRIVSSEADYVAALKPEVGLILSDFRLPQFDGMRALQLLKERGLDIPFILVSGAIGEEQAVAVMLQGAFAYVMKSRLVSLGPIVSRALNEAAMRREKIAAQEELRKSESRYRRLFESSSDGILILDAATGAVLDANPSFLALLGYGLDEIRGRALWELDAFKGLEAAKVDLRNLLTLPRVRHDDLPLTAKDGSRRDVEFSGNACAADGGKVIQCGVRDISERKRLQAQLFQAQKMETVGMLAGGIAHDFNNILMAIMGSCDFLRAGFTRTDPRRGDVADIEASAERAAALTRQLLLFSRKLAAQPVALDLNELIRNLQKMLRRLIGEDIELVSSLCPEPVIVRVDPGQMEQVIMNLSVNAREAMPKGGRLILKTEVLKGGAGCLPRCRPAGTPDCVSLEVTDTGCGMPPEVLAHLFEPFFTTRPVGKGTGLGLSTVYGIVSHAEGDVAARSVLGQGSTFTLCLPMAGAAPLPGTGGGETAGAAGGRETILLVEDDEPLLRINERILRERGYRVLSAHGGEDALVLLRDASNPVSLLLTDVVMPGLGGGELAQKAVQLRPDLKVAFITGYIDDRRSGELKALKGEILQKPVAPNVLALRVREILDRKSVAAGSK
ncbi:MAG: response regulator [Elusimicrobia bacterium]|nr:response regulator [Elusimicrobiota bacterium]